MFYKLQTNSLQQFKNHCGSLKKNMDVPKQKTISNRSLIKKKR